VLAHNADGTAASIAPGTGVLRSRRRTRITPLTASATVATEERALGTLRRDVEGAVAAVDNFDAATLRELDEVGARQLW